MCVWIRAWWFVFWTRWPSLDRNRLLLFIPSQGLKKKKKAFLHSTSPLKIKGWPSALAPFILPKKNKKKNRLSRSKVQSCAAGDLALSLHQLSSLTGASGLDIWPLLVQDRVIIFFRTLTQISPSSSHEKAVEKSRGMAVKCQWTPSSSHDRHLIFDMIYLIFNKWSRKVENHQMHQKQIIEVCHSSLNQRFSCCFHPLSLALWVFALQRVLEVFLTFSSPAQM